MKITFWGAARVVTGSCFLLQHEGHTFLVDCGLFQGNKELKEHNYNDFPFDITDIEFIILTHAHIDHSGLLPKLFRLGYQQPVYASSATVDLAEIMLPDCGYIQEMEVERKNRKAMRAGKPLLEPIYTAADAMEMQQLFEPHSYDETWEPVPGIKVVFRDAGHILGSAMVEIYYEENGKTCKIVFTGDLGRYDQPIIEDPDTIKEADYLIIESTYGNRLHQGEFADDVVQFAQIINDTLQRGGNVIIPAFAVDRTQDVLMLLNSLLEAKQIPSCSVYLDSPLAIKATEIFAKNTAYFDQMTLAYFKEKGRPPFKLDNLIYCRTAEESMRLNTVQHDAIIISASGMADAGRIKHHLKHNLWRKECSVVFFGYQAEGTLGRRLVNGEKKVTVHGEEIDVKANIYLLDGFSAHADKNELLTWVGKFERLPYKTFVVHGEEDAALAFAQTLRETYGMDTLVPALGDSYVLATDHIEAVERQANGQSALNVASLFADIHQALYRLSVSGNIDALIRVRDFLTNLSDHVRSDEKK